MGGSSGFGKYRMHLVLVPFMPLLNSLILQYNSFSIYTCAVLLEPPAYTFMVTNMNNTEQTDNEWFGLLPEQKQAIFK